MREVERAFAPSDAEFECASTALSPGSEASPRGS